MIVAPVVVPRDGCLDALPAAQRTRSWERQQHPVHRTDTGVSPDRSRGEGGQRSSFAERCGMAPAHNVQQAGNEELAAAWAREYEADPLGWGSVEFSEYPLAPMSLR